MGRTNREREELKAQGHIYYKRLGKWMTIDEIERYERTEDVTEKVTWWGRFGDCCRYIHLYVYL